MEFNDLLAPDPVELPEDPAHGHDLGEASTAFSFPASPAVWAHKAEQALAHAHSDEEKLIAYAFARTGYHRSLDRLRGHGWKGWGPVPFAHEPNQPVLRAIAALAKAARLIGEDDEYDRCRQMLSDADPGGVEKLLD
ncbi:DUF3151 domain-containing protein [Corynebacterium yudongzhengii]|uniref:DUF3151 domain-containing protein n=1 Tax=Corynebacterium yudongzhengii TaxID=2080740 RepID=A0A2U1T7D7_9CORY|nr:DUF3151 domain-containing protein [Corynebacterium yudongzhengii]AWB81365.1 DUF3151 domain-containing protein [Corynebacterium yudongzhengii]PWC01808.1 DUF3151 domain-containing protein [Corynebacterium yudongzhengii]